MKELKEMSLADLKAAIEISGNLLAYGKVKEERQRAESLNKILWQEAYRRIISLESRINTK